jgi:serine/threonine protein kinase
MVDDPRDNLPHDDLPADDETLAGEPQDGAPAPPGPPAPPSADGDSKAMAHPDMDELNELVHQPTLIEEQTTPEAKLINFEIPGYSIKSILGVGGMGTVYRAIQHSPKRWVALKVIRPGLATPNVLRRFQYESEALARLQHECIAQIYDAGTTDDGNGAMPWFAMEMVPKAMPITEYASHHMLSTRNRMKLFMRVCDAVNHGHMKGIIHRDLKPDNILVTPEGVPKIIDFGVARSTNADVTVTTDQTDVGAIIGTLQYMSPEQCRGNPDEIDVRTDVYALGVILYELLCGQFPYEIRQMALQQALRIVQEDDPRKPSTMNRRLRGDVEIITLKALEKEQPRRYQSALELEQDIDRYLNGLPIAAAPPSAIYRTRKFVKRNQVAVIASMLLLAVGLIALTAAWQWSRADAARQERNRMVSGLIDFYMVDHFHAISRLAGSQPARELIIDRSLEYLKALRTDAADDPELQRILAEGLQAVGNNQWSMRMGNQGDLRGALNAWEASADQLDVLHASKPGDERVLYSAIRVRTFLFDAYRAGGLDEDAARVANEQMALVTNYTDPMASLQIARLHFDVLMDQASMADLRNNQDAQLEILDQMRALAESTRSRWPSNAMAARDVLWALARLGALHAALGNHDLAMEHYESSLKLSQQRLAAEPENNTEQRDVMKQHRFIADLLFAKGEHRAAIERSAIDVLPVAKRLVELNRNEDGSTDARAETDLAQALQSHGQYLLYGESHAQAIPMLASARNAWMRLASMHPAVLNHARDSARTSYMLALAYSKDSNSRTALEILNQTEQRLGPLCDQYPETESLLQIRTMCRTLTEKLRTVDP